MSGFLYPSGKLGLLDGSLSWVTGRIRASMRYQAFSPPAYNPADVVLPAQTYQGVTKSMAARYYYPNPITGLVEARLTAPIIIEFTPTPGTIDTYCALYIYQITGGTNTRLISYHTVPFYMVAGLASFDFGDSPIFTW